MNSSSPACPEVQREFGHRPLISGALCQGTQKGAETPANSLPAQCSPDSSANSGFMMSSTEENKVASHVKQTNSPFTNMDEEERNRILVYMHAMLGLNGPCASESAISSHAITGKGSQGKDKQFPPDVTLSDKEYDLLLTMINTFKKWYPDLVFRRLVLAEPMIQSRDHIPLIAACCTGSLQNVKAFYGQLGHPESLSRQMLSISAFRNRIDLAGYYLEQGARLDTNDVYIIHEGIVAGRSFTTCKFLVAKGLDTNHNVEYMGDILCNAVIYNHLAWVRFYLKNGADPNLNLNSDTYSALANAARYASVDVASLLLEHNATLKNSGALALAARHGKLDMVKFLLRPGGTALHLVKKGRVDILKYLLESGANRNLKDHKGRTPLKKFLEGKDMKLVQALKSEESSERGSAEKGYTESSGLS